MIIFRFLKSLFKWIRTGRKVRSPERMIEIYSICVKCPNFNYRKGWKEGFDACGICQCNLHPTDIKLNKIAWKSERCPDQPPRWE